MFPVYPGPSYFYHKSEQCFYSGSLHTEALEDQKAGVDGKMKEDILKLFDSFLPTQGRNGSVYILARLSPDSLPSFILPGLSRRHLSAMLALSDGMVSLTAA